MEAHIFQQGSMLNVALYGSSHIEFTIDMKNIMNLQKKFVNSLGSRTFSDHRISLLEIIPYGTIL